MKRPIFFGLLTILILLAAGCRQEAVAEEPPTIIYGQDVGDECGMIINEPRFAAAYVTTGGVERRFDDIGDMLLYDEEHREEVQSYWVHDFHSEEWLKADEATFVDSPQLATPMGWGIAAFSGREAAEAYIADQGGTLIASYDSLHSLAASGELAPAPMGMGNMNEE